MMQTWNQASLKEPDVLGPLLFLCHINDLPDRLKSTVRMFADDCLIYREIKSRADQIQLQHNLQWRQNRGAGGPPTFLTDGKSQFVMT